MVESQLRLHMVGCRSCDAGPRLFAQRQRHCRPTIGPRVSEARKYGRIGPVGRSRGLIVPAGKRFCALARNPCILGASQNARICRISSATVLNASDGKSV